MNAVEFKNVTRIYPKGGVVALKDLTLSIPEGGVYGLLGRNGAGKTTLLRMIPALLHATEGTVRVFGLDPWEEQEQVKRDIGYLSEDDVMPRLARLGDILDLHASVYPDWDSGMCEGLLGQFKLERKRRMSALSKGQKRQVGLICAVSHRPKLLVLDEPAGGLDPVVRREFLEVVIELLAESGSTVILSSHLMSDLERVAGQIVLLHEGGLMLNRPLDELKENICRTEIRAHGLDVEKLSRSQGCLRAAETDGNIIATFECAPEAVREFVLGACPETDEVEVLRAVTLNLEDIFIELTGSQG